MNFLKNLAFQFWPLALMVAAIWTLPEKYHQALGQGWVALIAGFMIAGGVILWSLASRSAYEARAYRLGRQLESVNDTKGLGMTISSIMAEGGV